MIRLIVTDLDGTLLIDHETAHPESVRAIRRAMEKGVRFAVASGRNAESCSQVLERHGIGEAHIIAINGCEIADRPFGPITRQHFMQSETARETIRIYEKYGLLSCMFAQNAVVYPTEEAMAVIGGYDKVRPFGRDAVEAALVRPYKTFCVRLPGQEEAFESARAECARLPGVEITSSWRDNFEVMPEGIDKGAALSELAGRLGISAREIAAFGDSDNDLTMLAFAGYGFAMGNAAEHVKARAKRVTGRCDEGGVAQGIALALEGEG